VTSDAAPVLRRRTTCFRTDRCPTKRSAIPTPTSLLIHARGTQGAVPAVVETTTAALRAWFRGEGNGTCARAVCQCSKRSIELVQASNTFSVNMSERRGSVAPRWQRSACSPLVEAHLCVHRPGGDQRLRKVSLWLGHAHMQTTEIYTRADPS